MCCSTYHAGEPQTSFTVVSISYGADGECVCKGADGNAPYCCGAATQPDGLCDRCRTHCQTPKATAPEPVAEAVRERELVPA